MRALLLSVILFSAAALRAAPPANDSFSAATLLTGATVFTNGSNAEATLQAGENTRDGVLGATVWYTWQAPATGWVRIHTGGSEFDTVLQVFTGAALTSLVSQGWNDEEPDSASGTSSVSLYVTSGTTLRISLGGFALVGQPEQGGFVLNIVSGNAARPAYWPATVALNPAAVDVTTAPASVSAGLVVQSIYPDGTGTAVIGVDWTDGFQPRQLGTPAAWDLSLPQSGSPSFNLSVPRYFAPRAHDLWVRITAVEGDFYEFGGPDSGLPYILPPPPGSARVLTVTNTGAVDEEAPVLQSLTVTPQVDVTSAPGSVQISATLTDQPAGVQWVRFQLIHPGSVKPLSVALARTAGTAASGTWTGTLTVPRLYPTENYSVLLETSDAGENQNSYGAYGALDIPGGNLTTGIIGGGAYEEWAWSEWFEPSDSETGVSDDADGDGRPNLVSFAFGLDPRNFANGPAELPVVEFTGTGTARRLRVTWRQRKSVADATLFYTPQFTSSLTGLWQDGGASRTVTSINTEWERVTVEDTATLAGSGRRFARVKLDYYSDIFLAAKPVRTP